jgi:hypothetical protein
MKRLVALSIACLTAAMALPALAQPLEIIVRGGNRVILPSPQLNGNDSLFGWPNDPRNGDNFDPAVAAMNATNAAFPRRSRNFPVNIWLASDLGSYRGSWTARIEACQARFASYDPVTDTILVGGLPQRCPY